MIIVNSNNIFSDHPSIHLQKKYLQTNDNFRKSIFYLKADIPLPDKVLKKRLINKKLINKTVIKKVLNHVFHTSEVSITNIIDSTLHSVYLINFKKEKYVLKINCFSEVYHETQFLQELWINNLLQLNSLPSLPIEYIDVSRDYFPFDFIIMKEATGKLLHDRKLSKKKEREIFSNLGVIIAKIHSLTTTNYGPFSMGKMTVTEKGVGLHTQWSKFFTLNLNSHIDTCLKYDAITLSEKKQIEKIFTDNTNLLTNIIPGIIHNDLSARNMFVDKNNMTVLVDWEDAISGDPIYDIASFGTFCYRPEQRSRTEYFLEGYKKVRKLPEDFKKRYWLYYLRISLLKAALLARQGKETNVMQEKRIHTAVKELL